MRDRQDKRRNNSPSSLSELSSEGKHLLRLSPERAILFAFAEQFQFDHLRQQVPDHNVRFLHSRCVIGWDANTVVGERFQLSASAPCEAYADHALALRGFNGG